MSIASWTPSQLERVVRDLLDRFPPRQATNLTVNDLMINGSLTVDALSDFKHTRQHFVGGTGEPAFQNGWTNIVGGYQFVGFCFTPDGYVRLFGTAKSTTNPQPANTIFTLPPGFRPELAALQVSSVNGAFGQVQINTNGDVVLATPAGLVTPYVCLDNFVFKPKT